MQLQVRDDLQIRFAFTQDFRLLLRHEDILDEQNWTDISRQRNRELARRAIAIRVLLRRALSDLFADRVLPSQWRFVRTAYDKLVLADDGQPQAHFSLTHTRGVSAIAISKSTPVGIDIEAFDADLDTDALTAGLSRREQRLVDSLAADQRPQALLKLWTLKEAYTKLIGIGLSAHLPAYEFLADPGLPGPYRGTEEHVRHASLESWLIDDPRGKYWVSVAAGTADQ
jgi:4'-phosphopantetheinyl transferase